MKATHPDFKRMSGSTQGENMYF